MIYSAETDIVPFVKCLACGLQSYASANKVNISFSSAIKKQLVHFQPFLLSQSVVQLLCNVINLIPPQSKISVRLLYDTGYKNLKVEIENSGINLIRVNEICTHTIYQFAGSPLPNGTLYRLVLPLQQQKLTLLPSIATTPTANMPQFYKEVRNRFRTNFTQSGKLIATLEKNQPQEAAFMQKVNTLIKANIENEKFNTSTLCMEMALSITQLFRRVKSLRRLAPARHIKTVRLNSAKELLETSDWTVSEIAYKTGFQTISHFTKIFKKQYGIPPSVYRHSTKPATNE